MHERCGRARWSKFVGALAVAVLLAAAGCSGDDSSSESDATRSQTTGDAADTTGSESTTVAAETEPSDSEPSSTEPEITDAALESNLSMNGPEWTRGEPEIAIDPTNPNNLFYNWNTFPVPLDLGASVPDGCGARVSHDAGQTWTEVVVPVNTISDTLGCGDNVAAAGPDGTLYAGGITPTYTAVAEGGISVGGQGIVVHGRDVVSRSDDWGQTWTTPVVAMGSDAARFAPGGNPIDTFDRPWLAVDQSDGTLYVSGRNLGGTGQRFVTSSTDRADSFGTVYPIDSPDYRQAGGGTIAAAHGTLAVAYVAGDAPGETCPCVIFETSTDLGDTFERNVVPVTTETETFSPFVAASPVDEGRFALAILGSGQPKLQVYVTDDNGSTWRGPLLVGEEPPNERFKPWISYSPSGDIDLVWRTLYADGTYDVWAATARHENGDVVFSSPLKVTSEAAPYPDAYYGGDDVSWIIGDDRFVHVGWGDSRNGPVQAWYGRIPRGSFDGEPDGTDG